MGCDEESTSDYDDIPTGNSSGNNNGSGSSVSGTVWRGSEDTNTYLKFTSSNVTKCYNGKEVATGTYTSNSITFIVPANGQKLVFPLSTYSDHIILGVPAGYENTNVPESYYPSSKYPCDGDGGSNGSGNTVTTGNITFWTKTDIGCGIITVTLNNGQTGTISSYYSGGLSSCGADGSANFTLPAGNYSFTASCSKYKWSNTFTITAGSCSTRQLY
jgi:hypothetical protein